MNIEDLTRSFEGLLAFNPHGALPIQNEPDAYILCKEDAYGVFIVSEREAEQQQVESQLNKIVMTRGDRIWLNGNVETHGISFLCKDKSLLRWFAPICCQFLSTNLREELLEDPFDIFDQLMELTGNKVGGKNPSAVFVEFLTYLYLFNMHAQAHDGITITWSSGRATHDLEASDGSQFEAKSSTTQEYKYTMSSVFQAVNANNYDFKLFFCKLNEEADGKSINDLVSIAQRMGCDMAMIEEVLKNNGFGERKRKRYEIKYVVQEALMFDVNSPDFPKITPEALNGVNITGIRSVKYEIDLRALANIRTPLTDEFRNLLRYDLQDGM